MVTARAYSNIASATTLSPPVTPTSLVAAAISRSQINLTWTDTATNETGFKVERSLDGVTFVQIALVGSNVVSFNNAGLTGGTVYPLSSPRDEFGW